MNDNKPNLNKITFYMKDDDYEFLVNCFELFRIDQIETKKGTPSLSQFCRYIILDYLQEGEETEQ